jgi:Tol biopolymer transport system component
VNTGARTRLTTSKSREQARAPVWSPDGRQVAYVALRDGTEGLYRRAATGEGAEELLYKLPGAGIVLTDWSLNGRFLNYYSTQLNESILFALPLTGERTPVEVTRSKSQMLAARLSPDSRFIAYRSNETGKNEVFVRSFSTSATPSATPPQQSQISDGGLGMVSWRRDGRELFYLAADRGVMPSRSPPHPPSNSASPSSCSKPPMPSPSPAPPADSPT